MNIVSFAAQIFIEYFSTLHYDEILRFVALYYTISHKTGHVLISQKRSIAINHRPVCDLPFIAFRSLGL